MTYETPAAPGGAALTAAVLGGYLVAALVAALVVGFAYARVPEAELSGGMAAFGLAHIFYSAAFITIIRREGINRSGWPFAAAVLIASIALGVWFAPGQAAMGLAIPATAYSVIISIMVIAALMSKAPLMAKLGAVIFMASDTLIAVGMFAKQPVPVGSVWITYAAAQIMLAWSLSRRS